jgi:prepilin-type N-terminal cleavage/methylation domain-containing protein
MGLRKNKRGFSLVELIIVIAIMVALIVVMSPAFVKYVKKSHDAVMTQASEDVLAFVKSEFAAGHLSGKGCIKVYSKQENGIKHITIEFTNDEDGENSIQYLPSEETADSSGQADDLERFKTSSGVDERKTCKSDLAYFIYINNVGGISAHPIEVESTVVDNG